MEYEVCAANCSCDSRDFYDVMESRLMQMTFWAHKAVLFEKIKQEIEKQEGVQAVFPVRLWLHITSLPVKT